MNLRIPEQNKVLLVGRLTRDPEVRFTPKGQPICRFDIAVNRRYKNAAGEWQDETAFVPIVVLWRDMAERCGERLKKASPVLVEGRLRTRKWETKEGEARSTLEVIAQRVQFLSKTDLSAEEAEEAGVSPEEDGSVPHHPEESKEGIAETGQPSKVNSPSDRGLSGRGQVEPSPPKGTVRDDDLPF